MLSSCRHNLKSNKHLRLRTLDLKCDMEHTIPHENAHKARRAAIIAQLNLNGSQLNILFTNIERANSVYMLLTRLQFIYTLFCTVVELLWVIKNIISLKITVFFFFYKYLYGGMVDMRQSYCINKYKPRCTYDVRVNDSKQTLNYIYLRIN